MKKTILILASFLLVINFSMQGQSIGNYNVQPNDAQNSAKLFTKKNVLKWNLTPMIWNYRKINISYERATLNHRSFSINAGYFVLPSISLADSFNVEKNNKNWGFIISVDKRYYFKKRNTGIAPDGLYWGIFGSVHYYEFESSFKVINSTVVKGDLILRGDIGILSAGVEFGYQFVLKNNLTIDLIFMGPALSTYSGKLGIRGHLQVDKDSEYIQANYDVLVARFPCIDKLLDEKTIKGNGRVFTFGPGLRYMI